jgi:hypothetical protein
VMTGILSSARNCLTFQTGLEHYQYTNISFALIRMDGNLLLKYVPVKGQLSMIKSGERGGHTSGLPQLSIY